MILSLKHTVEAAYNCISEFEEPTNFVDKIVREQLLEALKYHRDELRKQFPEEV